MAKEAHASRSSSASFGVAAAVLVFALCLVSLSAVAVLVVAVPLAGQDVELLGRMYGTPVPQAYYEREAGSTPFEFSRAFRGARPGLGGPGDDPRLGGAFERFGVAGAVTGRFDIPVVLGLYSDSPPTAPYDAATVQAHFFDGPNPTGTISDYYAEASGGRVQLVGSTFDWQRVTLTQAQVAGGSSGLGGSSRVGEYIVQIVAQLDSLSVDWGQFDNDGPDGTPNSGDDDGFVDVLAVMHPTDGAECSNNRESDRIWSHRWRIAAQRGSPYVTRSASGSGGFVKVDNYTIQPVKACGGGQINQIGVITHELGHGFGLPDLYGVGAEHAAAGQWDLMGTGSWGCPGTFNPARPCMMGAWSREFLGWMDIITLGFGADHGSFSLEPAATGGSAYRLNTSSDDYYLLENRRPHGFDGGVPGGGGLLVWHVDADRVAARRPSNTVNSVADNQGVEVMQADGINGLATPGGGRGDAGDLFPGPTGSTAFHAGSQPASFTHQGEATGITLVEIQDSGESVQARLLSRFQRITVSGAGVPGGSGWVHFDGGDPLRSGDIKLSAPFQRHTVEAVAGVPISSGVRLGFESWSDGASRRRTLITGESDTQLSATYSGRQVELVVAMESSYAGVSPGVLVSLPASSDGWYPENASVTLEARARTGFTFREWSGSLTGASNPVTITLGAPQTAGASFDVTFTPGSIAPSVTTEGGQAVTVVLQAENANLPVQWSLISGTLPEGVRIQPGGNMEGAPLEPGDFPLSVRVVDGIGLEGQLAFTLRVVPPTVAPAAVAKAFTGASDGPQAELKAYLDAQGNANGVFDLGDFRAYVQSPQTSANAPLLSTGAEHRVALPPVRLRRPDRSPGRSR